MTRVYHGTTLWGLQHGILGGESVHFGGLYVTDTQARAARYANSRATGVVRRHAFPLYAGAVVLTLETPAPVAWMRRSESHGTLDQAEATIQQWRIMHAVIGRPGPLVRRADEFIAELQRHMVGGGTIDIRDSLPSH